jgi:hypothetical protein
MYAPSSADAANGRSRCGHHGGGRCFPYYVGRKISVENTHYPMVTAMSVIVSLPKMSITFTAIV